MPSILITTPLYLWDRLCGHGDISLENTKVTIYTYIDRPKSRSHSRLTSVTAERTQILWLRGSWFYKATYSSRLFAVNSICEHLLLYQPAAVKRYKTRLLMRRTCSDVGRGTATSEQSPCCITSSSTTSDVEPCRTRKSMVDQISTVVTAVDWRVRMGMTVDAGGWAAD